jgi:putative PIN family toxin of toxin-antitoxin system
MVDTNILVSVAVLNSSKLGDLLDYVCLYHMLVLSTYIVEEFEDVVKRKFPDKAVSISKFLMKLPFELEYTPHTLPEHGYFTIRDKNDAPILYSAITADVDILITGDKDFLDIEIARPEIMTSPEFLDQYRK